MVLCSIVGDPSSQLTCSEMGEFERAASINMSIMYNINLLESTISTTLISTHLPAEVLL